MQQLLYSNIANLRFSRIQLDCLGVLCAVIPLPLYGCAHLPSFPFPGVSILKTADDFDAAWNHPTQFQYHLFHPADRHRTGFLRGV